MPITVNGVEISDAAIHAEMQHHPAPSAAMAEYSAQLALVARQLMLQEAARLNLTDADEEQRLATLIEQQVTVPKLDEDHYRRFFEANRPRFRQGDQFEVSHILCAADPEDASARAAARDRAYTAITRLGQGTAFGELAMQISDCPSGKTSGHLGLLASGQTVPEFEQALLTMAEGTTSTQPVESRFGFHIIHLHKKSEGVALEYAQVRDQIAHHLQDQAQHQAIGQYLSTLVKRATIHGMRLPSVD